MSTKILALKVISEILRSCFLSGTCYKITPKGLGWLSSKSEGFCSDFRLGTALWDQLHQGWVLDIHHSNRHLFTLDVLDVPEQCFPFHVGGCVTHVSDVSGMCKWVFFGVQRTLKNSLLAWKATVCPLSDHSSSPIAKTLQELEACAGGASLLPVSPPRPPLLARGAFGFQHRS